MQLKTIFYSLSEYCWYLLTVLLYNDRLIGQCVSDWRCVRLINGFLFICTLKGFPGILPTQKPCSLVVVGSTSTTHTELETYPLPVQLHNIICGINYVPGYLCTRTYLEITRSQLHSRWPPLWFSGWLMSLNFQNWGLGLFWTSIWHFQHSQKKINILD